MRGVALGRSVSHSILGDPSVTNMERTVPDLAYNSMDFLAKAKRRDDRSERSSTDPPDGRPRKKDRRRVSSPLFVPRSDSREAIRGEHPGDKNSVPPMVRHRFDKSIPVAARPSTAPVEVRSIYSAPRRRGRCGPARAASSLDSRDFPTLERGQRVAEPAHKQAEDYIELTPELIRRRLWETGVFDGLRPATSAADNHQRLGKTTGSGSPCCQEMEIRTRGRARRADKSIMANLPGTGEDSVLHFQHGSLTQAKITRETDVAAPEQIPEVCLDPPHLQVSDRFTDRAAVIDPVRETPFNRTKIALMAHIPVYFHQESQTDSPWLVPQKPTYTDAGTQTMASLTQHCGRRRVGENAQVSPDLSIPSEPRVYGVNPRRVPDDAGSRMVQNYPADRCEEGLPRFVTEPCQTHRIFQRQMDSEAQSQLYPGCNGVERLVQFPCSQASSHPDHDTLSFVTPMPDDIAFDQGSPRYPWKQERYRPNSHKVGLETPKNDPNRVHRRVDRETGIYDPYPVRYMTDGAAALQLSDQGESVLQVHQPAFRILGEEPCFYSAYPFETLPRPWRPGILDTSQNGVPSCGHNMAEYIRDESRVRVGKPPHPSTHPAVEDTGRCGDGHFQASWRNGQVGFARRYGY